MAKTYVELTQQIIQLQAQAEARRLSEAKGVIRSINEAIATYGLTAADLKFAQTAPTPVALARTTPIAAPKSAGSAGVKSGGQGYSDRAGNTWTGRGPRPKWLREALATGAHISKFEVTGGSKGAPKAATAAPVTAKGKLPAPVKSKLPVKYRDEATGESWSGRGMKPLWLRQAISAGKGLDEFDVSRGGATPASVTSVPAPSSAPVVKAAAKSVPARKAAAGSNVVSAAVPAAVSASPKKAVPAKKLALASVPAKKGTGAVKALSKKSLTASPSAKKPAPASVGATKTERPTGKVANALQTSGAVAHAPVAAVDDLNDLNDVSLDASTVPVPAPVELVQALPQ